MHSDASEASIAGRHQQLADDAEHGNATPSIVGDDELVEGGARQAVGTVEHADTDVADELAVNAEHAHAAGDPVGNSDVTVVDLSWPSPSPQPNDLN
jgi:hypothetical protein